MTAQQPTRIKLQGFKSIQACDLNLGPLNILAGNNGSGKSNFLEFFPFIAHLIEESLQIYVNAPRPQGRGFTVHLVSRNGGIHALLHHARCHAKECVRELMEQ